MFRGRSLMVFMFLQLLHASLWAQNLMPNIVLIVADDLGYGDLGCYGAQDISTPNLDRLASEGVKFTNFYANAPECSPTRAALLTGRYQHRIGGLECAIGSGNIGRYDEALQLSDRGKLGLPASFGVLPSSLKNVGYQTALIGKWHLGYNDGFRPTAHGFDYSIGPLGGGVDYFHHTEPKGYYISKVMDGNHDFFRNDEVCDRKGYYITDLIADESVQWINIQNGKDPFFLYAPFTAPHNPLQDSKDYEPEQIDAVGWREGARSDYIPLVEDLDRAVGRILDKLDRDGIADNTIVIFFSDNGPTKNGSAGKLTGNKGRVFEGGIRVPCIIRWPGRIPSGTISDQTCISMDLTSSILSLAGGQAKRGLDGMDIVDHVVQDNVDKPRTLFWRLKRGANIRKAVRDDHMKYIYDLQDGIVSEFLFDLESDPNESKNLTTVKKNELSRLRSLLLDWEEDVRVERTD